MLIQSRMHKILLIIIFAVVFSTQVEAQENKEKRHAAPPMAAHGPVLHQSAPHLPGAHISSAAIHVRQESGVGMAHASFTKPRVSPSPRVYQFHASQPSQQTVSPNKLFHHHHHDWHPNYNFYNHQYHFYPYVYATPTGSLSSGYTPYTFNGETYYYDDGMFYQDQGDAEGYTAVSPPINVSVGAIPSGAAEARINGVFYYIYNGIYYRRMGSNYVVVEPPRL